MRAGRRRQVERRGALSGAPDDELIENIAAKQTALARADWPAWCARLEQTLARIADSPVVDYFRRSASTPEPAAGRAFRPDFAEADTTWEGRCTRRCWPRLEDKWGVGTCR